MNARNAGYWTATALFALAMTGSGVADLTHAEPIVAAMQHLGYPIYVATILGVAKLFGVVAILLPRTPRLKEWAFAGFTFDLLGAAISHASVGDPVPNVLTPLVLLAIGLASWALRPGARRLAEESGAAGTPSLA